MKPYALAKLKFNQLIQIIMTKADLLRKETIGKLPFTKQELINKVVEGIRTNGYYGFYWGRYTSKDMREFGSDSIHLVIDWIKEEGFRVERETSVYGVPTYYASL
jgi:hypothetical protein